ncbi:hypothetical protein KQX54_006297 [Cotesia glomerata]|uniref:Uncharacterized protein n=1 Tax=Cotesia glomerata TaxID=32391 RepID=A0AAV7ITI3_COTGL|nr:hypothetical protein KQX54_006297 [Cotesia glomerata]
MSKRYYKYLTDPDNHKIPRRTKNRVQKRKEEITDIKQNISDTSYKFLSEIIEENNLNDSNNNNCEENIGLHSYSSNNTASHDDDDDDSSKNESEDEDDTAWSEKPLYNNSPINCGNFIFKILECSLTNSLTKKATEEILQLLYNILPQPNNVPRNKYQFKKFLKSEIPSFDTAIHKHVICEGCGHYRGEFHTHQDDSMCEDCQRTSRVDVFVEYDIIPTLKDCFERRNLYSLIDKNEEMRRDQR